MKPNTYKWFCLLSCFSGFAYQSVYAADRLNPIHVEEELEDLSAQQKTHQTQSLAKQAAGQTLGDYLDNQANVDSASYGPGVGRPVVRGMKGYRIKILQNDIELSDVSAMSDDHAVALMPAASQRIELLKGPASVIYGAAAGGVVKVVDDSIENWPNNPIEGRLSVAFADNSQSQNTLANLKAGSDKLAIQVSGIRSQTENYQDGRGKTIQDSDVLSQQGQFGVAWRYRKTGQLQLHYTDLQKDYGIPNSTNKATRIEMSNKVYGFKVQQTNVSEAVEDLEFEVQYSDYLHNETEGASVDGLFGKKALDMRLAADYFWQDWSGTVLLGLQNQSLKVCHEHGACQSFSDASRTGKPLGESLALEVQNRGLPFSHGHPMPDTESAKLQFGIKAEKPLNQSELSPWLSWGVNLQYRDLAANADNVQETWVMPTSVDSDYYRTDQDMAVNLSAGWEQPMTEHRKWAVHLSYLQRLPSADELFWNGFHHATDSYIFGNRDLKIEQTYALDLEYHQDHASSHFEASGFVYQFKDYIFQQTRYENGQLVIDPYHKTAVWQTNQQDALFYGGALGYDWHFIKRPGEKLTLENQWDVTFAKLDSGKNLPRVSPMSIESALNYDLQPFSVNFKWKHVFAADAVAENESTTAGYHWLTLYSDWQFKAYQTEGKLWVKGENLLDEYAENHLSMLKTSAPLKGRTFSIGLSLRF